MSFPNAPEVSDIAMLEMVRPSQKSLETETTLSISFTVIPASSSALLATSQTSSWNVSRLPCSYLVCPTPITATLSNLLTTVPYAAASSDGAEVLDVRNVPVALLGNHGLYPHAHLPVSYTHLTLPTNY